MKASCLRYKRDDGLDLTATLYLPPGYKKEEDGRLPCIVSAYPREFKSKVGRASGCFSCLCHENNKMVLFRTQHSHAINNELNRGACIASEGHLDGEVAPHVLLRLAKHIKSQPLLWQPCESIGFFISSF